MKKTKMIFVCTGCTDRSPMATWIANSKIKGYKLKNVEAVARGLFVENNARVTPKVVKAVEHIGVPAATKIVPTELTQNDFVGSYVCFCMTPEQKAIVQSKFGVEVKTIAEAADFIDIVDTYGMPQEAFDKTAKDLDYAIEQIFERMYKGSLK